MAQADRILFEIQAEVGGAQNIARLTGLINHLGTELSDVTQATASHRAQMVAAEAEIRRMASGYAVGSAEATRLTQTAERLSQQVGRIDSASIGNLSRALRNVDTDAGDAIQSLSGIIDQAQEMSNSFAEGSSEFSALNDIIRQAGRSISTIQSRGITDLQRQLREAGQAGELAGERLQEVAARARHMGSGFAEGSQEAQRLAQIAERAEHQIRELSRAAQNEAISNLARDLREAGGASTLTATRLQEIAAQARGMASGFAAGSDEAQRLTRIAERAEQQIRDLERAANNDAFNNLQRDLRNAGSAGTAAADQLRSVAAQARFMALGFAAGSAEATRLTQIAEQAERQLQELGRAERQTDAEARHLSNGIQLASNVIISGFTRAQAAIMTLQAGISILQQVKASIQSMVQEAETWADAANKAATANKVFENTTARLGVPLENAVGVAQRLAKEFGVSTDEIKDSMTTLMRVGFTDMAQLEKVMEGAGASAIAAGRSAADGFSAVGDAAATQMSSMLNGIGIAQNLSTYYDQLAKQLHKSTDALTDAERAQAMYNLITEATSAEVEALGAIQNDYVRSKQQMELAEKNFSKTMGEVTMPLMVEYNTNAAKVIQTASDMARAWSEGKDPLEVLARAFPALSGALGQVQAIVAQVKPAFDEFVTTFTTVKDAISSGTYPLDALAKRFPQLAGFINQLKPQLATLSDNFQSAFQSAQDYFNRVFVPIFQRLAPIVGAAVAQVMPLLSSLVGVVSTTFQMMVSLWESVGRPVWDAIGPSVKVAVTLVMQFLRGTLDFIRGIFGAISLIMKGDWQGAWNFFLNVTEDSSREFYVTFTKAFSNILTFLAEFVKKIAQSAADIGTAVKNNILAALSGLGASIVAQVQGALNGMLDKLPAWAKEKLGITAESNNSALASLANSPVLSGYDPSKVTGTPKIGQQASNDYAEAIVKAAMGGALGDAEADRVVDRCKRWVRLALQEAHPEAAKAIESWFSGDTADTVKNKLARSGKLKKDLSGLEPGDVVFYDKNHTGIYIGDGKVIGNNRATYQDNGGRFGKGGINGGTPLDSGRVNPVGVQNMNSLGHVAGYVRLSDLTGASAQILAPRNLTAGSTASTAPASTTSTSSTSQKNTALKAVDDLNKRLETLASNFAKQDRNSAGYTAAANQYVSQLKDAEKQANEALKSKTLDKTARAYWEGLLKRVKAAESEVLDSIPKVIDAAQITQAQKLLDAVDKAQKAADKNKSPVNLQQLQQAKNALEAFRKESEQNAFVLGELSKKGEKASGSYIATASDLKRYGNDALKLYKALEAAEKTGDAGKATAAQKAIEVWKGTDKAREAVLQAETQAYQARKTLQDKEKQDTKEQAQVRANIAQALRQGNIQLAQQEADKLEQLRADALRKAGENAKQRLTVEKSYADSIYNAQKAIADKTYQDAMRQAANGTAQQKKQAETLAKNARDLAYVNATAQRNTRLDDASKAVTGFNQQQQLANGQLGLAALENQLQAGQTAWEAYEKKRLDLTLKSLALQRAQAIEHAQKTGADLVAVNRDFDLKVAKEKLDSQKATAQKQADTEAAIAQVSLAHLQNQLEKGEITKRQYAEQSLKLTLAGIDRERDAALRATGLTEGQRRAIRDKATEASAAARVKWEKDNAALLLQIQKQALDDETAAAQEARESGRMSAEAHITKLSELNQRRLENERDMALQANQDGADGVDRIWADYDRKRNSAARKAAQERVDYQIGLERNALAQKGLELQNSLSAGTVDVATGEQQQRDNAASGLELDRRAALSKNTDGLDGQYRIWRDYYAKLTALDLDFTVKRRERAENLDQSNADNFRSALQNSLEQGAISFEAYENEVLALEKSRLDAQYDAAVASHKYTEDELLALSQKTTLAKAALDIATQKTVSQRQIDFAKGELQNQLDNLEISAKTGLTTEEGAAKQRLDLNKKMLDQQLKADLDNKQLTEQQKRQAEQTTITKKKALEADYQQWLIDREKAAQQQRLSLVLSGLEQQHERGLISTAQYLAEREKAQNDAALAAYQEEWRMAGENQTMQANALAHYQQATTTSAEERGKAELEIARTSARERFDLELNQLDSLHDRKLVSESAYLKRKSELDIQALQAQQQAELDATPVSDTQRIAEINARYMTAIQATTDKARHSLTELQKSTTRAAQAAGDTEGWRAMRDQIGDLTDQIHLETDAVIKQGLEHQRTALQIKLYGEMTKVAIGLLFQGLSAIGGLSSDLADQWAQDMGSMADDLMKFGTQMATGNWLGAATTALSTIFNWFGRNKKAAEDAKEAAKDYNKQFRFNKEGYGTRSVEKYTTGILFWKTDHYKESVDEASKNLALGFEGAVTSGIEGGMAQAAETGDSSVFTKSLQTSLRDAALKGLTDAFLNSAGVAALFGPLVQKLTSAFKSGDKAQIQAATAEYKAGIAALQPQLDALTEAGAAIWNSLTPPPDKITQMRETIAGAVKSGLASGVKSGISAAIQSGDTGNIARAIRESVGSSIMDALIDQFIQSEAMQAIISPAMKKVAAAMATDDASDDDAAFATLDNALARYSDKAASFSEHMRASLGKSGLLGAGATDGTITNIPKESEQSLQGGSVSYQLTSQSSGGFVQNFDQSALLSALSRLTDTLALPSLADLGRILTETANMNRDAAVMQLRAANINMQAAGNSLVNKTENIRNEFGQQLYGGG